MKNGFSLAGRYTLSVYAPPTGWRLLANRLMSCRVGRKIRRWRRSHPYLGVLKEKVESTNQATYSGLNYLLLWAFLSGTQYTTWSLGLINYSPTAFITQSDTAGSHLGWSEITTYSGNRPVWDAAFDPVQVNVIHNAVSPAYATMTASGSVVGISLFANDAAPGDTMNLLFSSTLFTGLNPVRYNNGDTLQITYSLIGLGSSP